MLRNLKNNGFASIIEVIVTSVVFILAAFGVLTTISMFRPQTGESSRKMEAAYVGKGVIDDLRTQVDAATWAADPNLIQGPHQLTIGNYTVDYDIVDVAPNLRYLTMNVTWPDL